MEKYKKIVKVVFEENDIGIFAHSFWGAMFYPFKLLGKGLSGLFTLFVYPIWVIFIIHEYYNVRKVYWVKIKGKHGKN